MIVDHSECFTITARQRAGLCHREISRAHQTKLASLGAFVAIVADFDLLDPFGGENLVSGETAGGIGVKDRTNDVAALPLHTLQQITREMARLLTPRKTSMGLYPASVTRSPR